MLANSLVNSNVLTFTQTQSRKAEEQKIFALRKFLGIVETELVRKFLVYISILCITYSEQQKYSTRHNLHHLVRFYLVQLAIPSSTGYKNTTRVITLPCRHKDVTDLKIIDVQLFKCDISVGSQTRITSVGDRGFTNTLQD